VGLDVIPPVFYFPYHEESDVNNCVLEDSQKIQIARSLLEFFENFQHSSSIGFGVWGISDLLISDRMFLLPPLWVNYKIDTLKLLLSRTDVFVAPELLYGIQPTPASDVYVLGKILKVLLPDSIFEENVGFIAQMTHPDPVKRPLHYSRILSKNQYTVVMKPLSKTVRREFVSLHIIERDKELKRFISQLGEKREKSIPLFLVRGSTRVGKSTFLSLVRNELWNQGWKTILTNNPKFFLQELVQISDGIENAGIEEDDLAYLWNINDSFNIDRVLSIVGKLISTVDKLAILIDDLELVEERFFKLVKSIQNMIVEKEIIIVATMAHERESVRYDGMIQLDPFSLEQSEKLLELLLGSVFIKKQKEKVRWIYKITGGFPGYIIGLLNLLNRSGKLFIEEGQWRISQDMTSIEGFGDYIDNVFSALNQEEKSMISKIACLSEKFTLEELGWLHEALQLPSESMFDFFRHLQESGLIFPEGTAFRFSLKEVWQESYQLCPFEEKKALHAALAKKGTWLNKKAWHYKEIGNIRLAAKVYLCASRASFRNHEGFDISREYMEEVFQLLKPEEVTQRMKGWYAFLSLYDGKKISEDLSMELSTTATYSHYYLSNLILKEEYQKVEAFCTKRYGKDFKETLPDRLWAYGVLLEWATMRVKIGELDGALTLLNYLIDQIKNVHTYRHELYLILATDLLAQVYLRKNIWQTAYSVSEANITRAKNSGLTFLLPDVYLTAGSILFTYSPNFAQPLFETAIQVSKRFYSIKKSLLPTIELAYGFLYSGEIRKMFEYLEKARETAQIFNEKDALARSYIIEGLYHVYNKQWEEALEDYECARQLTNNQTLTGMVLRLSAILFLFQDNTKALDCLLANPHESMMEYGFEDVISLYRAKTADEIVSAFEQYKKNNQLWIEEVSFAFADKLSEHVPDAFEAFLDASSIVLLKNHQKLSLAVMYEAMAILSRKAGLPKKEAKYARDSFDLYKQSGMNHACQVIQEHFFNAEVSSEELFRSMSALVRADVINQASVITVFDKLEKGLTKLNNEIFVLRQIINFSKILTASSDPKEVLEQFTDWIAASIPVNRVAIVITSHRLVLYRSTIAFDAIDTEELVQEILDKKPVSTAEPFEVRTEFYIDDTKKAILYVSNQSLRLNTEDFEKMINFIEYLEPIMSMAIGNAISYKSSILDPLTRLYTRWYFNQRLEEEMEKALRMDSPLSVIMGDLDNFKQFNDRYGHKTGDEILVTVAQTMRSSCRKYDILGRYGGEEFILILPNTAGEEAYSMAERIRKAIEEGRFLPSEIKSVVNKVTISFGVASTDQTHYEKQQTLVSDADKALYCSKNAGKNKTTKFWKIGENSEEKTAEYL
jgi:diguanylate cyclase (GGDEF)-like protein